MDQRGSQTKINNCRKGQSTELQQWQWAAFEIQENMKLSVLLLHIENIREATKNTQSDQKEGKK